MGGVHPSAGVTDAITQLDSRIPLLHSERELIVQSLWDLAFNTGAKQGRMAGVEAVQNHIRSVAADTPACRDLLLAIAASFDAVHGEYTEPGQSLRERLAKKAHRCRAGDGC